MVEPLSSCCFGKAKSSATLHGKTVLVTGANTGIGLETSLDLARRGGRIIMACRNLDRANKAAEVIREKVPDADLNLMKLDTSSLESVRQFAAEFSNQENRLDILILNAGIRAPLKRTITDDGLELTMATNHYGHFLLTMLLLDLIIRSQPSRIVIVSSSGHLFGKIDLQDTTYENKGHYKTFLAYCDSKLANVLFAKALAKKLSGTERWIEGTMKTEIFMAIQDTDERFKGQIVTGRRPASFRQIFQQAGVFEGGKENGRTGSGGLSSCAARGEL
ncbi:unnamed protein product [Cyprideis torosa]|uniref:Uncharacterized protein n=1 Tax=Cyprideis torosa TaxID=163714 RepID=A0A7R8W703_9CRUS|nr:unnamed protein product [Cyprideis torosa]CAG0887091.1 unnamed protein product [Cyprideis torosa]